MKSMRMREKMRKNPNMTSALRYILFITLKERHFNNYIVK